MCVCVCVCVTDIEQIYTRADAQMGMSCVKITCLKLNRLVDVWNSVKCRNYSRNITIFFSYFVDCQVYCISIVERRHMLREATSGTEKHYTKNKGFSRIDPCLYRYSFSYNTVEIFSSV